jgi:hypothetical protein
VHKRTLFRVQREECQGEDTHRVTEHSVSSTRSALSRCKECTGPTHSEVLEKLKETELLNTKNDARSASVNLKEFRIQEEDLCKECTRPTIQVSARDFNPFYVQGVRTRRSPKVLK